MKNYSDYLICSDFDGTLHWGGIPENNIRAIERFQAGGGRFTLCTGRKAEGFLHDDALPFPLNAPMIGLSGAQIFDLATNTELERHFLDDNWQDLVDELIEKLPYKQHFTIVSTDEMLEFDADNRAAKAEVYAALRDKPIYKIHSIHTYEGEEWVIPKAQEICEGRVSIISNGMKTYEFTALGYDKGYGAQAVKRLTGAKTLICIGDYSGDYSMLLAADIACAVDNAADALKAIAHRITVHAKDGALADLIDSL